MLPEKQGHAPSAPLLVPGGPRPDTFKAEDRGELRWGDCVIDPGCPGLYCKKCDLSFGGRDDVHVGEAEVRATSYRADPQ